MAKRAESTRRRRGSGAGRRAAEDEGGATSEAPQPASASAPPSGTILPKAQMKGSMRSFMLRFTTSWIMVLGTLAMTYIGRQLLAVAFIAIMQGLIYRELVLVSIRSDEERALPSFKFFYYYWFVVCAYYFYARAFREELLNLLPPEYDWLVRSAPVLCFGAYALGFVLFVLSLEKRHYAYQFARFAYCHVALVVVVVQSTYLAANTMHGLLWFLLPCGMVVCNDVFAYIFGFFFGRTPLIQLSPKKTWEGFIGGGLTTLLWAFWWCALMERTESFDWNKLMLCPSDQFGFNFPDCDITQRNHHAHVPRPLGSFLVGRLLRTASRMPVLPFLLATIALASLPLAIRLSLPSDSDTPSASRRLWHRFVRVRAAIVRYVLGTHANRKWSPAALAAEGAKDGQLPEPSDVEAPGWSVAPKPSTVDVAWVSAWALSVLMFLWMTYVAAGATLVPPLSLDEPHAHQWFALSDWVNWPAWRVSATQLHAMAMALFASLVAPFGGFFGSGVKRAMGVKDFGSAIPGHGGFTDRMDCQLIMGAFTYVYLNYIYPLDTSPSTDAARLQQMCSLAHSLGASSNATLAHIHHTLPCL